MPLETVFVTLHIHTDGPIPGPHSLLTLSSAAHQGDDYQRSSNAHATGPRQLGDQVFLIF